MIIQKGEFEMIYSQPKIYTRYKKQPPLTANFAPPPCESKENDSTSSFNKREKELNGNREEKKDSK